MEPNLPVLLPPGLLVTLFKTWLPFDLRDPLPEFCTAARSLLFSSSPAAAIFDQTWPVLLTLSKLKVPQASSVLMNTLPDVEDPNFPIEAVGLILLLDQAPRVLCKGIDQRWVFGHFDEICAEVIEALEALHPQQKPSAWVRWERITSPQMYILIRGFINSAIVHCEGSVERAVAFTEGTRRFVEELTGARDKMRDLPEQRWDLYGFPKLLSIGGPPVTSNLAETAFWTLQVKDSHRPILDAFGRYPFRSWALGREITPEEQEWLDKAAVFKAPLPAICSRIMEDVSEGIWSPLGSVG